MASTLDNQDLVTELCDVYPDKTVPCYGVHPWFLHEITLRPSSEAVDKDTHYRELHATNDDEAETLAKLLPQLRPPIHLDAFLDRLEHNLLKAPKSFLGEVGLDKSFRLIDKAVEEGEPKRTSLSTPMSHQLAIVEAQIDLAFKHSRNISLHSVRAPQETMELLKTLSQKSGWHDMHLCLHSFGGSPETAQQIQKAHPSIFFSFSTVICSRSPRFLDLLRAPSKDRILVESDLASADKIDEHIWDIFEAIKEARGWSTEECVDQLERNWTAFTSKPTPLPPKRIRKSKTKPQ